MEDTTALSLSEGNTSINATSDDQRYMLERLVIDIGGQDNLSMFMTILQKYTVGCKLQILESEQFNQAISSTIFSFSYAYHDKHLFRKFLELSPAYVAAPWFVQQYTYRKRYKHTVSLGEILQNSNHDGTQSSTIITLGTIRVSVPVMSDDDKDTIEKYFNGNESRKRINEKLSRFFSARNDEWIKFLSTIFPNDIVAKEKITVIKVATKLKNTRNKNYRSRERFKQTNNKTIMKKVMLPGERISFETVNSDDSTEPLAYTREHHESNNENVGDNDDSTSSAISHQQHAEDANIEVQTTDMDISSSICISELTNSVPPITTLHSEVAMVNKSQIDNIMHLLTNETQDAQFETCNENMRKDAKLMEYINTATSALVSTRNSSVLLHLFCQTFLDKLKDGNSEQTSDWETLSSTTYQQCVPETFNDFLTTISRETHTTVTRLNEVTRMVTSKRRRRTVSFLVEDPRDERLAVKRFLEEYRKDIIPEDFVLYGKRHHLPHIHNRLDFEPYIHFPWENNSCALDSIMTAWWVLFNNIKSKSQEAIMEIFKREYTELQELFCDMYDGRLDNLQAKEKVREIFQGVSDSDYQCGEFIELTPINNYIDETLYDQNHHTLRNPSLLHWRITVTQKCMDTNCILYDKIVKNELTQIGEFELLPTPASVTSHIQSAYMESVTSAYANQKCVECQVILNTSIESNSLPHVIKVRFPSITKDNRTKYKILSLDKSLILENTKYNILGAIYGDGGHFVFRYIFDDMIFEADGMHLHQSQIKGLIRHSAESIYITDDYEKGMSVKIRGTKLTPSEIYYVREYTIVS